MFTPIDKKGRPHSSGLFAVGLATGLLIFAGGVAGMVNASSYSGGIDSSKYNVQKIAANMPGGGHRPQCEFHYDDEHTDLGKITHTARIVNRGATRESPYYVTFGFSEEEICRSTDDAGPWLPVFRIDGRPSNLRYRWHKYPHA